ncbi:hypothetical protein BKA70DRAFT_1249464 [Coprinopsis sp. MPI-PUGE-AT-0042]|nr:hypothetical protein BKA70DRAFT_1249464 [Coprinopsis sp. MPI-PUGE-AT-0042]
MSPEVRLPPEIWIDILRQATHGPLWLQLWRHASVARFDGYEEWKANMVKPVHVRFRRRHLTILQITKIRVVRVCKDWYSIGVPFLYEHIVLKTCERIPRYTSYMSQPSVIDPMLGPLGRHTKRLDIGIKDFVPLSGASTVQLLLQQLPNLRAFVAAACKVTINALDALPSSLEYFECRDEDSNTQNLPPEAWGSFLTSHPNLRCTVIPPLDEEYDDPLRALTFSPALSLQQLVELRVYPSQFITDCLPALHSIKRLGLKWWYSTHYDRVLPFYQEILGVIGRDLTALSLSMSFHEGPGDRLQDAATLALRHCTNLKHLAVKVDFDNFKLARGISTSVNVFGVQLSIYRMKASRCTQTFERLLRAKIWFPQLNAIQFFARDEVSHLRNCHSARCERGAIALAALGISLQDHLGAELIPVQ